MKTEEITMKTAAIYSDDNRHRFLLDKSWGTDKAGKKAMIVMLFPCAAEITQLDLTTMLCLNNAAKLEFDGISIVNLYSKMNAKNERKMIIMSKVYAVVNQKGGVGKTTTCANIGIGLA